MARYLAVAEELHREIERRPAETNLPTKRELAKRFGVSRPTIRQAMRLLEFSGLVSRRRGRGTIVAPRKVKRFLTPVITMEEDLRGQGLEVETRLLGLERSLDAPDFVREALDIEASVPVGRLAMLRLVAGQIISFDSRYFSTAIAKRISPLDVIDRPVSEVVQELAGQPFSSVDWEIEIVSSSREVSAPLKITPEVPVVSSKAINYLAGHEPIEVVMNFYRIDRVKFRYAARFSAPSTQDEGTKAVHLDPPQ